jgi:hypothetical protein
LAEWSGKIRALFGQGIRKEVAPSRLVPFFVFLNLLKGEPEATAGATNDVTRRRLRCRPGTAAALEERQNRPALQLPADDYLTTGINAADLKQP